MVSVESNLKDLGKGKHMSFKESELDFLKRKLFIYLAVVDLCCCSQAFSIAVIRGYPLVAESGLLTAVAYFVEHGL